MSGERDAVESTPRAVIAAGVEAWVDEWAGERYEYEDVAGAVLDALDAAGFEVVRKRVPKRRTRDEPRGQRWMAVRSLGADIAGRSPDMVLVDSVFPTGAVVALASSETLWTRMGNDDIGRPLWVASTSATTRVLVPWDRYCGARGWEALVETIRVPPARSAGPVGGDRS